MADAADWPTVMRNPVVHFEILGPDGPATIAFYRELFGWDLRKVPMAGYRTYAYLPEPDQGIGGGVGQLEPSDRSEERMVTIYVEVSDPQAILDQAVAKNADDQAQLIDAQKDFARFTTLQAKNFDTQQNVDQQQAKVDHFKASIDADQGAIEAAQTQLAFTTITAPIDGVVGFRQVDVGNIIHTTDSNPLTVLTQIKPCYVIFTLPQSDLGPVREAMLRGSVSVLAFDQNDKEQLAEGHLLLIDNQIDQTTSTIRLKAEFPNEDERLWPGEFVRIRILITTYKDAVTVPPVAVQRGPDGYYLWVVKADNTVEQRPIGAQMVNDDVAIATKGLAAGERVVTNGQSRLDVGSHVAIKTPPPGEQPSAQQQANEN